MNAIELNDALKEIVCDALNKTNNELDPAIISTEGDINEEECNEDNNEVGEKRYIIMSEGGNINDKYGGALYVNGVYDNEEEAKKASERTNGSCERIIEIPANKLYPLKEEGKRLSNKFYVTEWSIS